MIEQKEKQIAENNRSIEENKTYLSSLRVDIAKHKEAISGLEKEIANHNGAVILNHDNFLKTDKKIKEFIELNYELESELQTLRHEAAVKSLLDDEPDFWDAIQARLTRKINELDDGMTNLGSYIEPREFAEKIKELHKDPKNLSPSFQKVNNAKAVFEGLQKEACSQVFLQKPVPLESKTSRLQTLDTLLTDPVISPLWNKQ